jgi:hypothetical protein
VNNFVTQKSLDSRLYLPFNISQARLVQDTAQPVAFVGLVLGQRLRLAWLHLHLIRVLGGVINSPTKINPSLGACYTGLYGSRANYILQPPGQPMSYVSCEVPGCRWANPVFYEDVSSPDIYSVIVINNFKDAEIDVSVSGAFCVETF